MEIEKLSRDVLVSALIGLQKTGLVKDEDILEAIKIEPSNEMKRIVDLVHGFCCQAHHDQGGCEYYSEDQMTNCWTLPAHKEWLDDAIAWMNDLGLQTEHELSTAIHEARIQFGKITQMKKASRMILARLLRINSYV